MEPVVAVDALGDLCTIEIDTSVYDETTIFKSAYWFTDRFFLYLKRSDTALLTIELRGKEPITPDELRRASREFCNSLIDFKVRQAVLRETGAIREALVAKAFSEGLTSRELGDGISDESRLPASGASYHEDAIGAGKH